MQQLKMEAAYERFFWYLPERLGTYVTQHLSDGLKQVQLPRKTCRFSLEILRII